MRNLWWKEWRETRGLLIVGMMAVIGTYVVPMITDGGDAAWDGLALSLAAVLPLFAALCAAGRFAGEAQTGTLLFLLSQPISRWQIWLVKTAVTMLSAVPVCALAVLLHIMTLRLFAPDLYPMAVAVFAFTTGIVAVYVIIPITLLLSALLDKPALSVLGGLAGTGAVIMWAGRVTGGLVFSSGEGYDIFAWTWNKGVFMWVIMLTFGAVCLVGSALVFMRGGMRQKAVTQSDRLRYIKAGD